MTDGILVLAGVVFLAAFLGVVARFLRQPMILAYLLTGVVIALFGWTSHIDRETFHLFSDLGIMFLLFLVGLEINYASLKVVGWPSVAVGVGQIAFTSVIGYGIARLFGFPWLPAAYIAVALTFSSTIIIVKLLSEKRDLQSLYGKISVGMLLVQDLVAILLLVALAGFDSSGGTGSLAIGLVATLIKGIGVFAFVWWLGRKMLPFLFDRVARSHELLFLISLAWVFGLAAIVSKIGLSLEIAGFLAGIALANSSENFEIASRLRPLRDFFILIFFVILGSSLAFADIASVWLPVAAFSLFVLVGNPLIVFVIMSVMGYRSRTSFLTGLTVAQISEFSLVLAALGAKAGHIDQAVVSIVTAVGMATIGLSAYFIVHADTLYRRLARVLKVFERRMTREDGRHAPEHRAPVVLIGAHRTGQALLASLPRDQVLVIDFDPDIAAWLARARIDHIFGDIADDEVFERARLGDANLVISTSPSVEDNAGLLEKLGKAAGRPARGPAAGSRAPTVIVRAEDEHEAEFLYRRGADYVLLPNFTAGQYLGKTIALDPQANILRYLKERDVAMLGTRSAAAKA